MASGNESTSSLEVYETGEITQARTVYIANGNTTKPHKVELPQYYTAPPLQLMRDDLFLFMKKAFLLPLVAAPVFYAPRPYANYPKLNTNWIPWYMASTTVLNVADRLQSVFQRFVDPYYPSGEMDELYPSVGNLTCLAMHIVLIFTQLAFLCSLPMLAFFPFHVFLPFFIGFIVVNYIACIPLNAGCKGGVLGSNVPGYEGKHDDEEWLFLNGVSVGTHWLQGNLNRLSRTFHRHIVGVHNETAGIVFDIIQCLIERCFYYGTSGTRTCYSHISGALSNPSKKRVILILHSQGGLEGSLILDWLLAHSSRENMKKLEIYTFGNAANHFNNPKNHSGKHAVKHIEHYANSGDFVASWGVTHFKHMVARQQKDSQLKTVEEPRMSFIRSIFDNNKRQYTFHGNLFQMRGKWGHLLNQHYLDRILPLNKKLTGVEENLDQDRSSNIWWDEHRQMGRLLSAEDRKIITEKSRLWKYVNGGTPDDEKKKKMINGDR